MVAGAISWPRDIFEYLDTDTSPLNPHNRGHGFFVYGTFPLFFTKAVAEFFDKGDYINLTIVGRQLSAIFDLGTVILVFLICRSIVLCMNKKILNTYYLIPNTFPLLSMFLYSIMVLSIQLSHFFAVDTYLTFFTTLCFYLSIRLITHSKLILANIIILGLSFGLAIASKISALMILPFILIFLFISSLVNSKFIITIGNFAIKIILFSMTSYLTVRLTQPYLFSRGDFINFALNPKILDNWKQLTILMKPSSGFPPSIQWFHITPLLFPLKSLLLWGLGLPLGILVLIGLAWMILFLGKSVYRICKSFNLKKWPDTIHNNRFIITISLIICWILSLFLYQGIQPAPTIRYFHPIYPFLGIIAALSITHFSSQLSPLKKKYFLFTIIALSLVWPIGFQGIYQRPHSRVIASDWIYQNIPKGSTLAVEHWDDGLPLSLDQSNISEQYKYLSLPLYNPDKIDKWKEVSQLLAKSDYILLTSNRLWGSLTRVPEIYPFTSRYYRLLFSNQLGFEKVAEITSYPEIKIPFLGDNCLFLLPPQETYLDLTNDNSGFLRWDRCKSYLQNDYQGLVIRDDWAEETFTVYDHPKVIIFKKVKEVNYLDLLL
jgi:hypothetical protein